MASQKRIDSSRANGAKSRGPVTPEGKKRSSQNATTHGILSDFLLLDAEETAGFDILAQAHRDRFQPADLVEHGLIEEMCAAKWRLYRLWAVETDTLNAQIALETGDAKLASAFNTVAPSAALMHRYEAHLQRVYQRALRTLIMVRTVARPDPALPVFDPDTFFSPQADPPNKPSPTPEEPPPAAVPTAQPVDSSTISPLTIPATPAARTSSPPARKEPGGAVRAAHFPNFRVARCPVLQTHAPQLRHYAKPRGAPGVPSRASHNQAISGEMPAPIPCRRKA